MGISDEIKSTKFGSSRNKAMINILYTSNCFRDLYKSAFKKYDLLLQHFNALRIINGRFPEPISPGEIKDVMLDKGPDVTRLIDKLVHMGLVDRCQNTTNRRIMEIRISEKGQSVLSQLNAEVEIISQNNFGLSEAEAEQLSQLLDKARIK